MSSDMDTSPSSSSAAAAAIPSSSTPVASASSGRPDGRLPSELRPLSVEHGLLHRADGSVQWTQGGTSVLVGVYGPRMVGSTKDEKSDRAAVIVNFKAANGHATNLDIERGSYVRQSFEPLLVLSLHPRCKIEITIQVVRDCGGVVAAALNATTLALIDAGVAATALLSAVTIAAKEKDTQKGNQTSDNGVSTSSAAFDFMLDPVSEEVATCASTTTFAFASTAAGVLLAVNEAGAMDQQTFFDATQLGRAACAHVQQFIKISLERRNAASA